MKNRNSRVALVVPLLMVSILFPVILIAVIAGFGTTSPALACDTGLPVAAGETVGDTHLDAEQMQVATQIVAAVRAFAATSDKPHAAVVALAAARQESGIRNLDYGDRDSLGAFQQRPSQGWGTPEQVRDVPYATTSFLTRLVQVPGWETIRVTEAAALVQRPAKEYEGLYEQWVPLATALTERLWPSSGTLSNQPASNQTSPGGQSVRLAQANLYAGMSATEFKTDLARVVAAGPDVVTLNETYRRTAREITPPGYASWRAAGPFDALETPVLWRTDAWELVDRGTAVMHKRQVKWGTRFVNWVTLRSTSTGHTLSVISGHASPGGPGREGLLQEFVTNLDALIGSLSAAGPVLVGADLNTHYPRSEFLTSWLAASGAVSTFDMLGEPAGGWATGKGGGIIDYILVTGATAVEHQTQTLPHSDHRMLAATVNLTGQTAATGLVSQTVGCVGTGGQAVPANCSARGGLAEAGLTPDALRVMRCALTAFGPHVVGGLGERPNPTDHTAGRAVDIMIAGWDTPTGNTEGWTIALWAQANAQQLGVTYVIFDAKIWSTDRNAEGWRPYTHPTGGSNPTLDHVNHVHISVHGSAGSSRPIALTVRPRVA